MPAAAARKRIGSSARTRSWRGADHKEVKTTEKHEEKASEILARAAKLLNDAQKVYDANFELMKEQDALQQDVVSAALDEVQASVFSALADEKPELYRQVVQFLDKKRKEGL